MQHKMLNNVAQNMHMHVHVLCIYTFKTYKIICCNKFINSNENCIDLLVTVLSQDRFCQERNVRFLVDYTLKLGTSLLNGPLHIKYHNSSTYGRRENDKTDYALQFYHLAIISISVQNY